MYVLCMYVCMCVHTFVCMYVRTFVCIYVCYTCMYVCTYVGMYVYIYVYTKVFLFLLDRQALAQYFSEFVLDLRVQRLLALNTTQR
jgi:hypothetical protein